MSNNYIHFETIWKNNILTTNDEKYYHIYENAEENNTNNENIISQDWPCYYINHLDQLSAIGSSIPPQLPPRNKKKIEYKRK